MYIDILVCVCYNVYIVKQKQIKGADNMGIVEQATNNFIAVRDSLEQNTQVYRSAWKKPLMFYLQHTKEEAIKILLAEVAR